MPDYEVTQTSKDWKKKWPKNFKPKDHGAIKFEKKPRVKKTSS